MAEKWLPILGYEGRYEVSDLGRVRSLTRRVPHSRGGTQIVHGRTLKLGIVEGYCNVVLSLDGKLKSFRVHALVARMFIGPRPDGMWVCHDDNDPQNPRLSNLRYDTPRGNHADKKRHGTQPRGADIIGAKLTEKDIPVIRKMVESSTHQEVADVFGVSRRAIGFVACGSTWKHVPRATI